MVERSLALRERLARGDRAPISWARAADWLVPAVALTGWYVLCYLADPSLPGRGPGGPAGWWSWHDQAMTLRSAQALARGDLDPAQHHYPLGYSLLGVPFLLVARDHPFFFVDLLSLLGAFAGFVAFARRAGLAAPLAAVLFAGAALGNGLLFRQWVVPWNTTPTGAFAWLLLAGCAAWLDGRRRPFLVGALAAAVPACRPSDALAVVPCLATLLWADLWTDRLPRAARLAGWAWLAAGAALVLAPLAALHLAIYGPTESPYMRFSAQIGFTPYDLGWKAYVLLLDPYPWFADGEGLVQRVPWIALGLAGIVPALARGPKSRMLAATLVAHVALYVAYLDLLPIGLWRFMHVHYLVWAVPGCALLAALLVRDLARPGRARRVACLSVAATAVVLCLRCVPKAVAEQRPAKAVDFAGALPPFTDTYLDRKLALRDDRGVLLNNFDVRAFIYPGGVRVIGLRRDFVGAVRWLPGEAPQGFEGSLPSARWAISTRLAWPPPWLDRAPAPAIPVPTQ